VGKGAYQLAAVVGLTAHRELGDAERESCAELRLAPTDTEWTTLRDALVAAFKLDDEALTPIFAQRFSPQVAGSCRMGQAYS